MKKYLLILLFAFEIIPLFSLAQFEKENRNHFYEKEWENYANSGQKTYIVNDSNIDVKFYHLDLSIAVDSHYISGSVYMKAVSVINNLGTISLNLQSALIVDSITFDALSFLQANDKVMVTLNGNYAVGMPVELKIYYHGIPVLANGIKGLNYNSHGNGEPVIATLSTPFLAHYWWPCKDGPQDKADSVYTDISIKDTNIAGYPLIAVSNGILAEVDSAVTGIKKFSWKHSYPIVPYYIMAAISNYRIISQNYNGISSSFPLNYYVFDASYNNALAGVVQLPAVFDRFSQLFGDYPFKNEKYGMTELGFYGAIENQTNTIINTISPAYFYTSVHELAHQWFGDMITCKDWHHGWLNEGFATYAEALIAEHLTGFSAYTSFMAGAEFYVGGTIYLPADTNPFGIFQSIIYNKGAYVLHMLRGVLGNTLFFNSLNTYSNSPQFKYKNATTEDFRQVCENVTGQNLQYFFDQWIYDEYYPMYKFNFYSQPALQQTDFSIFQEQSAVNGWRPVFKMPIRVKFFFSGGADTTITVLNDLVYQHYSFNFSDSVMAAELDPDQWVLKQAVYDPGLPAGIANNLSENKIYIYPNPTRENIQIQFAEDFNKDHQLKLLLFNLHGEKIIEVNTQDNFSDQLQLNLSGIKQGLYLLHIRSDEFNIIRKIIKI